MTLACPMPRFATVVAFPFAPLPSPVLRTGCSEGLVRLPLFLAPSAWLVTRMPVLQVLGLLTDVVDKGVGVDGGRAVDKACRREESRGKFCEFVRDAMKDRAQVFTLSDGYSCGSEFLALVAEG